MPHRKSIDLEVYKRTRPWHDTSDGQVWLEPDYGVVYAIGARGRRSLIKVGHTTSLRTRFQALHGSSPLPLALRAHWAADIDDEAMLHELFADRRRHGEWFDFAGLDYVSAISKALKRPPRTPVDVEQSHRPWGRVLSYRGDQGGLY